MKANTVFPFLQRLLDYIPADWVKLTTHRLDIYHESLAKTEFLDQFEELFQRQDLTTSALAQLPTAYDYIRLGHPLSSVLEWTIGKLRGVPASAVISFASTTAPILAVLRKNLLEGKATRIYHTEELPKTFDAASIKSVYGYSFEIMSVASVAEIPAFEGSTLLVSSMAELNASSLSPGIDFHVQMHPHYGSVIVVIGEKNQSYISEIQHVRRRETIAMTPVNCLAALKALASESAWPRTTENTSTDKAAVLATIRDITHTDTPALIGSSGLSIQYAIMMGLVHHAQEKHPGKAVKFVVPPNCYGGTNDQARRVAACLNHVEVVDLPVDGDNDMVTSVNTVLERLATENAVPYIIAEIPTNPRVEVPELEALKLALSKVRKTASGARAIAPIFILDQTFCPNVNFLGEGAILSSLMAISYVSGSKFPSGGQCTAGYCVGNTHTAAIMEKIGLHLGICDNEATAHQYTILAMHLPTMNQRIHDAYQNTRAFVSFIQEVLPEAKINFVSEALAQQGFTPSVFSLDLPTKGANEEEREIYKRAMNLKLINLMIGEIPDESKYCVSYGQLRGCYWTIPATSTQGTTKEGDKDYIARVALSPAMDLARHKKVFQHFVDQL